MEFLTGFRLYGIIEVFFNNAYIWVCDTISFVFIVWLIGRRLYRMIVFDSIVCLTDTRLYGITKVLLWYD